MLRAYHIILSLSFFIAFSFSTKAQVSAVEIPEYNSGFNTITEALDFLKNESINNDITLELNARNYLNEPSYLSTFGIEMNGYSLTITGISNSSKARILMDGTTPHVIDNYLSNITLKNLVLEGADPSNTNGSILRQKGNENNIRLEDVDMIGGYCGIRATTKINGLYLTNISTSRVPHGSFRLGNGSFSGSRKDSMLWERDSADYDMYNVEIRNITLHDDLENEAIPNTSEKYNGFFLLKKVYNLVVDGVKSTSGNGGGVITVENSRNVVIRNVRVDEFGFNQASSSGMYLFKCDHLEVYNNMVKTRTGDPNSHVSYYFNVGDNISFCHNTGVASQFNDRLVFGFQLSRVNSFEANLLKMKDYACILEFRNYDGYSASIQNDWIQSDYNALSSSKSYLPLINLEGIDGRDYLLMHDGQSSQANHIDFSDFQNQYNRDNQSHIAYPESEIEFVKFSYYLTDQSLGRNIVDTAIVDNDINGYLRSLPSDAGAFDADNAFDIGLEASLKASIRAQLYPSPNTGNFTIEIAEYAIKNLELEILNTSGKNIGYSLEHSSSGGTTYLKVQLSGNSPAGIYYARVNANNKSYNSSFVVK